MGNGVESQTTKNCKTTNATDDLINYYLFEFFITKLTFDFAL